MYSIGVAFSALLAHHADVKLFDGQLLMGCKERMLQLRKCLQYETITDPKLEWDEGAGILLLHLAAKVFPSTGRRVGRMRSLQFVYRDRRLQVFAHFTSKPLRSASGGLRARFERTKQWSMPVKSGVGFPKRAGSLLVPRYNLLCSIPCGSILPLAPSSVLIAPRCSVLGHSALARRFFTAACQQSLDGTWTGPWNDARTQGNRVNWGLTSPTAAVRSFKLSRCSADFAKVLPLVVLSQYLALCHVRTMAQARALSGSQRAP
ncbi:hypothetical protein C8R47DRAFT_1063231 [Mycena vitilis]|nr:hypothetical protein C8R47DRAFT_1063231 [Mycena vitilis]